MNATNQLLPMLGFLVVTATLGTTIGDDTRPHVAPPGTTDPNPQSLPGAAPSETKVQWPPDRLRAELIRAVSRGESLRVAAANLETFLHLKPGTLEKTEEHLEHEVTATEYEEVENLLRQYPKDLFKPIERADSDGKITVLEYEVIKVAKDDIDRKASITRIKAQIHEFRWGKK